MDNKIIISSLENDTVCKLAKIKGRGVFSIDCGNGASIIELSPSGYYLSGVKLPSNIHLYFKSLTSDYIITRTAGNDAKNISISTLSVNFASSPVMNDFEVDFDLSGYVELNLLNPYPLYNHVEGSVAANTVTNYISRIQKSQYSSQSSLVMISLRNSNGNGGSALLFLHRKNENTINNFTIQTIYSDNDISRFNITANSNGFSISDVVKYNYSITELSVT